MGSPTQKVGKVFSPKRIKAPSPIVPDSRFRMISAFKVDFKFDYYLTFSLMGELHLHLWSHSQTNVNYSWN